MRLMSMIVAAVAALFVAAAHGAQDTQPVVLKAAYVFDSKSGQLTQGNRAISLREKDRLQRVQQRQFLGRGNQC